MKLVLAQRAASSFNADWTKVVFYDLARLVLHFGLETAVDDLEGREGEIDSWLRSLTTGARGKEKPIGAGLRAQIRRNVLRFLDESGVLVRRKNVTTVRGA